MSEDQRIYIVNILLPDNSTARLGYRDETKAREAFTDIVNHLPIEVSDQFGHTVYVTERQAVVLTEIPKSMELDVEVSLHNARSQKHMEKRAQGDSTLNSNLVTPVRSPILRQ